MGKRQDLRAKRKLKRFFESKKKEAQDRKIQNELNQIIKEERDKLNNTIESQRLYYALFGVTLALMCALDWLALQTLNYQTIHDFGPWKAFALFVLYGIACMLLVPRENKGWGTILLGISIFTAPLLMFGNVLFSGKYETELLNLLLSTAALSLCLSPIVFLMHHDKHNPMWLLVGFSLLCPIAFIVLSAKLAAPASLAIVFSALAFGGVFGFSWADTAFEYPRSFQNLARKMFIGHFKLTLVTATVLTNVWVILFVL